MTKLYTNVASAMASAIFSRQPSGSSVIHPQIGANFFADRGKKFLIHSSIFRYPKYQYIFSSSLCCYMNNLHTENSQNAKLLRENV